MFPLPLGVSHPDHTNLTTLGHELVCCARWISHLEYVCGTGKILRSAQLESGFLQEYGRFSASCRCLPWLLPWPFRTRNESSFGHSTELQDVLRVSDS
jgi:hypothetical protein